MVQYAMIKVSDNAAEKISNLLQGKSMQKDSFLRVKVKRGGCSGFSYKLDFDQDFTDKDKKFTDNKTTVVIDSQSLLYILGMTLDYDGGLNGSGFVFSNPNATKTCGCGSSFSV